MEGKELTAKEMLDIFGEICTWEPTHGCLRCPIGGMIDMPCFVRCISEDDEEELIEICKKWKKDRTPIETEWSYICRIIQDDNGVKKCVYEEDITEREDALPFGGEEFAVESVLKKYCNSHKGKFFATVERIFKPKERRKKMYINPFIGGVIATLFVESGLILASAIYFALKYRKEDSQDEES